MDESSPNSKTGGEAPWPADRPRWIAAVSYLSFFCFFSLWKAKDDPFIRFHARQGFMLLLAECVAFVTVLILELTIGKLRFIGLVIVGLIQLVTGLGALTMSVVGFVKALFGESWHLPILGDYAERVPDLKIHGR